MNGINLIVQNELYLGFHTGSKKLQEMLYLRANYRTGDNSENK